MSQKQTAQTTFEFDSIKVEISDPISKDAGLMPVAAKIRHAAWFAPLIE